MLARCASSNRWFLAQAAKEVDYKDGIGAAMPRPTGFVVTLASVAIAVAMLAWLLLVASFPYQNAYRDIDAKLRYVSDVAASFDRLIGSSVRSRVDYSSELGERAAILADTIISIDDEMQDIYVATSIFGHLRRPAMVAFNSIDSDLGQLLDVAEVDGVYQSLAFRAHALEEEVTLFGQHFAQYVSDYAFVEDESRRFVYLLRESGRAEFADEVFQASTQIIDLVASGEPSNLQLVDAIVERATVPSNTLSVEEQASFTALLDTARRLGIARRNLDADRVAMDLDGFQAAAVDVKDSATSDYVYTLSTVNDARVLLNVYTVLLLCVLTFFGLRLRSSYKGLNIAHGLLEEQVGESSADLEMANEQLQESQGHLVQAEKMSSLGQLVAGVMHEINTPLLVVLDNTTVSLEVAGDLREYLDVTMPIVRANGPSEAKRAVQNMLQARQSLDVKSVEESVAAIRTLSAGSIEGLNQISELVESLKEFSRLDRVIEDHFDVREGLEKTLTITKNLLNRGIEVEKRFDEVPRIYCSPARINQVFINLITNAAHAMNGKGRLSIRTRCAGDWVEIVFEDTGCGIPEEHLNKIMDPFFTTKPAGGGSGLGLSIVRQIVEEHHGQILVDSKVGHGTRITLGFPIRGEQAEEAA